MKFSELPIEVQEKLNTKRLALRNHQINDAYEVLLYNQSGSRFSMQEGIKDHGKTTRVIICHLVAVLNGLYDMDVSASLAGNK